MSYLQSRISNLCLLARCPENKCLAVADPGFISLEGKLDLRLGFCELELLFAHAAGWKETTHSRTRQHHLQLLYPLIDIMSRVAYQSLGAARVFLLLPVRVT